MLAASHGERARQRRRPRAAVGVRMEAGAGRARHERGEVVAQRVAGGEGVVGAPRRHDLRIGRVAAAREVVGGGPGGATVRRHEGRAGAGRHGDMCGRCGGDGGDLRSDDRHPDSDQDGAESPARVFVRLITPASPSSVGRGRRTRSRPRPPVGIGRGGLRPEETGPAPPFLYPGSPWATHRGSTTRRRAGVSDQPRPGNGSSFPPLASGGRPGRHALRPRSAQLVDGNWLSALTITAVASGMREGHWY